MSAPFSEGYRPEQLCDLLKRDVPLSVTARRALISAAAVVFQVRRAPLQHLLRNQTGSDGLADPRMRTPRSRKQALQTPVIPPSGPHVCPGTCRFSLGV